ncbi:MAG TPA: metallophosphoesterase [Clostridiaceae bacterium]|nr:metallophosphoesterase [Clostridiaceae bacterium]
MIYFILLALMIFFITYMRIEASWVEVNHIKFTRSSRNLKVLHISDLHINRLKVSWRKIKNIMKKENPDLILITGDCIEKEQHTDIFLDFIDYLNFAPPVCLCLGNHDHRAFSYDRKKVNKFISEIEKRRITVLDNSSICFSKNEKDYNIIGIDDLREGNPDIDKALSTKKENAYINIAVSHNPDIVYSLKGKGIHYLFCGHLHGGQIWAPFNLEFRLLREDKLGLNGIRKGLHRINGINLYISRGLGNVTVPLRFMSRPEITIYYLP